MKFLSLCLVLLLVSGCAEIKEHMQKQEDLRIACEGLAAPLKKDQAWLDSCLTGDSQVFAAAIIENMHVMSKEQLCLSTAMAFNTPYGTTAQSVASERKFNCDAIVSKFGKDLIGLSSVGQICGSWYDRNLHPLVLAEVNKEVADKKLDCVQVVNAQRQTEAMRLQAAAAESQAAAARSAAAAAWSAGFQQNINANRPRTCNTFGSTTTCY